MLEGRFLNLRRSLLWVDCLGGLTVGLVVVLLSGLLSTLYGLPRALVLALGIVNLIYGSYSLSLALRRKRPLKLINLLVGGNLLWGVVCLGLALAFFRSASPVGLALLFGEGLYVGGLGLLEGQSRELLLTAQPRTD